VTRIPLENVYSALQILSDLVPPPLAMYWEYQDDRATVLFVVNVADQTESSIEQTYFKQLMAPLSNLIPETDLLPAWMLIFQDSTGHLIASCCAGDPYVAL
jgi:hypothetical protein